MDIIFSELQTMNRTVPRNKPLTEDQASAFLQEFVRMGFQTQTISLYNPIYLALGCQMDETGAINVKLHYGQNFRITRVLALFDWWQLVRMMQTNQPKFLHGITMMDYMVASQFSDESVKACYAVMMLWSLQDKRFESNYWCDDVSRHLVDLKLIEEPEDMHDYAPENICFNTEATAGQLAESVDQILYYYNQQQAIENPHHIEAYHFH